MPDNLNRLAAARGRLPKRASGQMPLLLPNPSFAPHSAPGRSVAASQPQTAPPAQLPATTEPTKQPARFKFDSAPRVVLPARCSETPRNFWLLFRFNTPIQEYRFEYVSTEKPGIQSTRHSRNQIPISSGNCPHCSTTELNRDHASSAAS